MRAFLLLALLALPAQGHPERDPIGRLVARLNGSGGLWVNGIAPLLEYPATVDPEVLVGKILAGYSWAGDKPFRILESREVAIDDQTYRALLVDTAAGPKIVLLQHHSSRGDWWSKVMGPPAQEHAP